MRSDQEDKIRRLPVKFRTRTDVGEVSLKIVAAVETACDHIAVAGEGGLVEVCYLIREGETEVECGHCSTRLEPMWVLNQMARRESRYRRTVERCHEAMKRLAERSKTRCECCGQMTGISRSRARR
jgi:hypothetical protein